MIVLLLSRRPLVVFAREKAIREMIFRALSVRGKVEREKIVGEGGSEVTQQEKEGEVLAEMQDCLV